MVGFRECLNRVLGQKIREEDFNSIWRVYRQTFDDKIKKACWRAICEIAEKKSSVQLDILRVFEEGFELIGTREDCLEKIFKIAKRKNFSDLVWFVSVKTNRIKLRKRSRKELEKMKKRKRHD